MSPQAGRASPAGRLVRDPYEENSAEKWDAIWEREGDTTWRTSTLSRVYALIEPAVRRAVGASGARSPRATIIDLGGGRGILAARIGATVWDRSRVAVAACRAKGLTAEVVDLELPGASQLISKCEAGTVFVATECYEHLREPARRRIVEAIAGVDDSSFILSVPNDRLGPEDEPQHAVKFTAASLMSELSLSLGKVNVYVVKDYLLAVWSRDRRRAKEEVG